MAKAKKTPSGSWRVLVYSHTENGKRKYKSFTSKDKKAAEFMAAEYLQRTRPDEKLQELTLAEAIGNYIESNRGVLSPSTIQGYEKVLRYAFTDLMAENVYTLSQADLQRAVSKESKRFTASGKLISPKTVKNEFGLVSSALKFCGVNVGGVRLPKIPDKFIELPPADVVFRAVKDTDIELPCLLACWLSFSMSEIRGLKCSSVRNGKIYIEQVLIDVKNESVEKKTGKADKRLRVHELPDYLMTLVGKQDSFRLYSETGKDGYLVPMSRDRIYGRLQTLMAPTGYTISFHQLRHLNASVMLALNIPEKYAMERGGWKTPHTMKKVYEHTFSDERQKVDRAVDDYFEGILAKMQLEMQRDSE